MDTQQEARHNLRASCFSWACLSHAARLVEKREDFIPHFHVAHDIIPIASRCEDSPHFLKLSYIQRPMFDSASAFEDELCDLGPGFIVRADRPLDCGKSSSSGRQQPTEPCFVSVRLSHLAPRRRSTRDVEHGDGLAFGPVPDLDGLGCRAQFNGAPLPA